MHLQYQVKWILNTDWHDKLSRWNVFTSCSWGGSPLFNGHGISLTYYLEEARLCCGRSVQSRTGKYAIGSSSRLPWSKGLLEETRPRSAPQQVTPLSVIMGWISGTSAKSHLRYTQTWSAISWCCFRPLSHVQTTWFGYMQNWNSHVSHSFTNVKYRSLPHTTSCSQLDHLIDLHSAFKVNQAIKLTTALLRSTTADDQGPITFLKLWSIRF